MIDTPKYLVLKSFEGVELREYSPYIVAEVDVEATSLRAAANQGFRPLADYIFGNNSPNDKIAMTSPVTAQAKGDTIAMTTPVTAEAGANGLFTVRFSMPPTWTMDSLPTPTSERVRLTEVAEQRILATGFRGKDDLARIKAGARELIEVANRQGFKIEGEPYWAGYSAPYIPVPLRKWEMLAVIAGS